MRIVTHISQLRALTKEAKAQNKSIGFVPTMGALHEGHLSLIRQAKSQTNLVIASIFVNPEQFGPGEDFDRYPRQPEKDAEMLQSAGADILFLPSKEEVYPQPPRFKLLPGPASSLLCGKSRPGHFSGVGIVVAKLLNMVSPDRLFLGQKDLQQTVIIRQLIEDLNFPVELVVCPIVREADGLAMSSRNRYLSAEERQTATGLNLTLRHLKQLAQPGATSLSLLEAGQRSLKQYPGLELDYLEIVNGSTLESVEVIVPEESPVMAIAAFVGKTRLIDNEFLF
jgi:pantoate--beta-alanine ligase